MRFRKRIIKKKSKVTILVVDDKKVIGDLFEYTLGFKGYKIIFVDNAKDAIASVQQEQFDIAFIDIVMPSIDGITILKTIKSIAPNLPIVTMSGYSVEDKRKEAIELGAVACIVKPFEIEEVRKIIKGVIKKEV